MKKRLLLTFLISFIAITGVFAQGVSVNTTGDDADASAMLDVASTTSGMLIPRMLETERTAIASPAEGLMVYQTDGTEGFYYYDGTNWVQLGAGGTGTTGDIGEMFEYNTSGSSSDITVTAEGTFYGWISATTGITNGVTFDDNSTADRLTATVAGDYKVDVSISFGTSTTNHIVEGSIFKNGVKVDNLSFRRKLSSSDLGVAVITGIVNLSASDYIDLRFSSDGNGDIVQLEIVNTNIVKVN